MLKRQKCYSARQTKQHQTADQRDEPALFPSARGSNDNLGRCGLVAGDSDLGSADMNGNRRAWTGTE